jgi:uncharacterized GH25 family protein
MKKQLLFTALLLISLQQTFAHAIWIESNPLAKKSVRHEVSIFFGEYGENERDTVAKWFSDLKEVKLWLVAPDGQRTALTTSDATDHLSAGFTPVSDGIYTLLIYHIVKDLHGKSKIEYNASATVAVGQHAVNSLAFNNNEVSIFSEAGGAAKVNAPLKIQSFFKSKPSVKQKVTFVSPGGWEKNEYTSENGTVTVTPVLAGVHMIEVMYNIKEPGEHNGKPYEGTWKIATYCVKVGK